MSFAGYRDSVRQTDADALGMAECALPLFDFSGRLGCNRRLRSAGRTSRPSLVEAVKRSTMQHRTHRGTKLVSLTAAIIGAGAIAVASPAPSAPAGSPAPPTALAGTSVLDPNVVLAGLPEPGWFKDNIPLLDVPESRIQQVYYYRWGAYKRHLRYTTPTLGYTLTEFVHGNGNTVSFGAIDAAAGHHIYEGRWLKSPQYMDDYQNYWMTGPGRTATSGFDT